MHRAGHVLTALTLCALLLSVPAGAVEMVSQSYRLIGANLNGGGHPALVSTSQDPTIGVVGASLGQSEALGFSGSALSLRTVAPGFWWIVGGGVPTLDSDGDAIAAYRDNCRFASNPTQSDVGGVQSTASDGIGDACQCGDVDADGIVDFPDVDAYRDSLADPDSLALTLEGVAKCSVIDSAGPCEVLDVTVIQRALEPAPLLPGIDQVCAAATGP